MNEQKKPSDELLMNELQKKPTDEFHGDV